jgi:hypothetical protein
MSERTYAKAVCWFVFLAMGFCGWYENYVPVQVEVSPIPYAEVRK